MKYFILAFILGTGCSNNPNKPQNDTIMESTESAYCPYDLSNPSDKFSLPKELDEISGIDFYSNEQTIACHNDEKGKIYLFDLNSRKTINEFKFNKDGDYEDIAVFKEDAYLVRSDGRIYEIKKFASENNIVKEYKTDLSERNDIEGLCFNLKKDKLLLACKSSPNINESDFKDSRAIYAFDLAKKELESNPYLVIKINEIKDTINTTNYEAFSKKLVKKFASGGDPEFQPSAIAIHPITNDYYILSSVGNKLVIIDQNKKVKSVLPVSSKIFKQPEGICFKSNGNMLISNEDKGGKANILEFNYLENEN